MVSLKNSSECFGSRRETATLFLQVLTTFFVLVEVMPQVDGGAGLYMGPYFPLPQMKNITVHQNTAAYLPCMVKQLGDKTVSWIRHRDSDILTVDQYTFVRDERLTVHYTPKSETWTLVIKYAQERDAGTYECQISTEPKMSTFVHLNVIVPEVKISGSVDKYVRLGSTTRLECTVSSTVQLPDYIFWYHSGERLLEYDHPRLKISVSRRGGQGSEMSITSVLVIRRTQPEDKGNYTCLPSNLHPASTMLHVLSDEHPAAMQTGAAMLTDAPSTWRILAVVLFAFLIVNAHQHLSLEDHLTSQRNIIWRKDPSTDPHQEAKCQHSQVTSSLENSGTKLRRRGCSVMNVGDSAVMVRSKRPKSMFLCNNRVFPVSVSNLTPELNHKMSGSKEKAELSVYGAVLVSPR